MLPKFPLPVGKAGRVPGGVTVNMGNGVDVSKADVGLMEPAAVVGSAVNPTGVAVGRGRGGLRNVYTNAIPSRQIPLMPQPNPPNRNLSNVLKNF